MRLRRARSAAQTIRSARPAQAAGPVVAVVTDAACAVQVARRAVQLAGQERRPLLLLVPLPALGFTIDPVVLRLAHQRRGADAAAVLGRIAPALGAARTATSVRVVPHSAKTGEGSPAVARAVLAAAARAGAAVLVAPGALPVDASTHRHRTVLIDPEQRRWTDTNALRTGELRLRPARTVPPRTTQPDPRNPPSHPLTSRRDTMTVPVQTVALPEDTAPVRAGTQPAAPSPGQVTRLQGRPRLPVHLPADDHHARTAHDHHRCDTAA